MRGQIPPEPDSGRMSPSRRSRGSFPEFERRALQACSDDGFKRRFAELSRAGDRSGMVSALLEVLEPLPQIADLHRTKDEARARELLRQVESTDGLEKSDSLMSEALSYAPVHTKLFFELLARRARLWYSRGELVRCRADCRYLGANESTPEEIRIDAWLLLSDCCRAAAAHEEARNHLNEAMRRIGELAGRHCKDAGEQSETFKAEKARLLKDFLERKKQLVKPEQLIISGVEGKELPMVEGKTNEFLSSCSDAVALGSDEVKGKLLYATRNIKPGSVLIVDKPFSFSTDVGAIHRNCLNCHASFRLENKTKVPCESCQTVQFCSEECRRQAWNKFHKYECRVFDYFYENKIQRTNSLLAYRTVVTAALHVQDNVLKINEEFLHLHNNDRNIVDIKSLKKYEPQDYKTVFSLKTHCAHADPKDNLERAIHSIFFAKCLIYSLNYFHSDVNNHERYLHILAVALIHNMQAINCNAYEIVENVRDEETKILEPRNIGGAIYTTVSLTNHSCYPNIVRHTFPCGTVVVTTIRFIPQGSEILDCYGQHFLENQRDSRHKLLEQKYYFKCQCEACLFDWPLSLPSDKFYFKCKKCSKQCRRTRTAAECTACGQKTEISKLYTLLQNSIKKRLSALTKMYDGHYKDALPLLLEHANCIDKILSEPSLEAVKTQQSIIQCLNAMSSTSI